MQATDSDDDISVTHSPAADELPPPPEEDIADENSPPHTESAIIMAPAVPWSTKRISILETDAANIQAWLAAVRLFCSPDQCCLTNSYVGDNSCLISE
jgi:hypothetical protein